jgi:hypothetical protein
MASGLPVNARAPHVCTRIFGFCKFGVRCKFTSIPTGGCLHHARGTCTFGEGCSFLHHDDFRVLPSQFPLRNDEPLVNSVQPKFHNRGLQTDGFKHKSVSAGTQVVSQGSDFGQTCRLVLRTRSVGCQASPPVSFASSCPSSLPWTITKTGWSQTRGRGHKKTATDEPERVHAATDNPWSSLCVASATTDANEEEEEEETPVPVSVPVAACHRRRLVRLRRRRRHARHARPGPGPGPEAGSPNCTALISPRVTPRATREAAGFPAHQDHQDPHQDHQDPHQDHQDPHQDHQEGRQAVNAAVAAVLVTDEEEDEDTQIQDQGKVVTQDHQEPHQGEVEIADGSAHQEGQGAVSAAAAAVFFAALWEVAQLLKRVDNPTEEDTYLVLALAFGRPEAFPVVAEADTAGFDIPEVAAPDLADVEVNGVIANVVLASDELGRSFYDLSVPVPPPITPVLHPWPSPIAWLQAPGC